MMRTKSIRIFWGAPRRLPWCGQQSEAKSTQILPHPDLDIEDIVVGTGKLAAPGNIVTVSFTGELVCDGSPSDYKGRSVSSLKEELRERGLKVGGKKIDLVNRLLENNGPILSKFDGGLTTFPLGKGKVIQGWEEGIRNMRVGGKRSIIIRPGELTKAVRNMSYKSVPDSSTLIFTLVLLGVIKAPHDYH